MVESHSKSVVATSNDSLIIKMFEQKGPNQHLHCSINTPHTCTCILWLGEASWMGRHVRAEEEPWRDSDVRPKPTHTPSDDKAVVTRTLLPSHT